MHIDSTVGCFNVYISAHVHALFQITAASYDRKGAQDCVKVLIPAQHAKLCDPFYRIIWY